MSKANEKIELFVPGRLCLFGEHSDWAGVNRTMNPDIVPGCAIVTGVEQGIYGTAYKSEKFIAKSTLADGTEMVFESEMDMNALRDVAREGEFFSYIAGVASYMCEWYHVGGMTLEITKMDLPMKSGLSSSAAICVLVARAFNILYDLHLNTLGLMNIAYWGELRTPSRCGRLDQACAFGVNPVSMIFDGNELDVEQISVKKPLHYVVADLMASKDTVKILHDLNEAYPFPENEIQQHVFEALGPDNKEITDRARKYINDGEVEKLGKLMIEAQDLFDKKVAPQCPEELTSPVLHSVLNDERIKEFTYGAKGVGSQGDGTVQFLAKDAKTQADLIDYLENVRGMSAFPLTLRPAGEKAADSVEKAVEVTCNSDGRVRKAIIPVAGFGTRLYPQTRGVKKEFCPVVDFDGLVKPAILVLLEELERLDIEEICLILNRDEKKYYEDFFFNRLLEKHLSKLSEKQLEYEKHIEDLSKKLTFVFQDEQKGFGHAVYQARSFANDEPVLLMLGDTIYQSNTDVSCTGQLIDNYNKYYKPMIALQTVPLEDVGFYGIFAGEWEADEKSVMKLTRIAEKPSVDKARDELGMNVSGQDKYHAAFGSYIITKEVFKRLEQAIDENITNAKGEIELTDALAYVADKTGMYACVIDGASYDLGNPEAYRKTVSEFGRK